MRKVSSSSWTQWGDRSPEIEAKILTKSRIQAKTPPRTRQSQDEKILMKSGGNLRKTLYRQVGRQAHTQRSPRSAQGLGKSHADQTTGLRQTGKKDLRLII